MKKVVVAVVLVAIGLSIGYCLKDRSYYKVDQLHSEQFKKDHPERGEVLHTWKSIGKPWRFGDVKHDDYFIIDAETGKRIWISGPITVSPWD